MDPEIFLEKSPKSQYFSSILGQMITISLCDESFFYNCGGLARNLTVFEHFCHVEAVSCCCRSSHSIAMFFAELVEPAAGVRTLFSSFFFYVRTGFNWSI